jgi:diguanylate cyclase (GGDEF)-like protein
MGRARGADDDSQMTPSTPLDPGAATSTHALQRWFIAGAIVVVAALSGFAITALRANADRARHVQGVVAELSADTQRISRVQWEATAQRRVGPELDAEHRLVQRHIDRLLLDYSRSGAQDGPQLGAQIRGYLRAVATELRLLDAGRVVESARFDRLTVDSSSRRLQQRLHQIGAAESSGAREAAGWADRGVIASLLLAALILIVLLSRVNGIRSAAARERNQDLEAQALHDALTGLPNRRKLLIDLERELVRQDAGERCVLILCDLDGFKAYNDTFGHPEGDLLLSRLGKSLARTVAPHGAAYRLGGDEFCALLRVDQPELERALAACHAALGESGAGFDIRASIGFVVLSEEATDASTALRLADHRMYAQKYENGSSARRQLRDLILRVLAEQDSELYTHLHDVARLAAGVGRSHGMNGAEVANLVRAAELHDVGKVAIPDSILSKPGSLDPQEQEFMRRHTLIGESILSAAPALGGIGRLVRSSHERYDGTGYPDGLRGGDIPLSSRIIFVCDTFNAMTSERPYSPAMSQDAAIAELKRCSSTQFDPAVVDTFVSQLDVLDIPLLNEDVIVGLEDLGREVLPELLSMYFDEAAGSVSELGDAIGRGNALVVRKAAHKLKGGSGTLGAAQVAHLASELEATARGGDLTVADELLDRLRSGLDETRDAFHNRVAESSHDGSTSATQPQRQASFP